LSSCRQAYTGGGGPFVSRTQTSARSPRVARAAHHLRAYTKDQAAMAGEGTRYAIVKTGGKQYKVAAGDVVKVEKIDAEPGAEVELPVALVVDGASVTTAAEDLANVSVSGEILEHTKGPKIRIHKFKNKTGYHKRQGHRQQLTVLKVTGIK
jgi:large subunit ribosomal protein L21